MTFSECHHLWPETARTSFSLYVRILIFQLTGLWKEERKCTPTYTLGKDGQRGGGNRSVKGESQSSMQRTWAKFSPVCHWCGICFNLMHLYFEKFPSPFSRASICSWVKDVLFLCSFRFSWSRIWASSESSPFELMELVFSPPPSCCWQPSATKRIGQ